MATTKYKTSSTRLARLQEEITNQGSKIDQHQSVTYFFVVVVAATLVSTLVGIAGVYIIVITDHRNTDTQPSTGLIYLQKEIDELNIRYDTLRAKNPYLK